MLTLLRDYLSTSRRRLRLAPQEPCIPGCVYMEQELMGQAALIKCLLYECEHLESWNGGGPCPGNMRCPQIHDLSAPLSQKPLFYWTLLFLHVTPLSRASLQVVLWSLSPWLAGK